MDSLKTITPTIAIAGQPTEDDLRALKKAGYVAVVNLRHDGEPDQPLDHLRRGGSGGKARAGLPPPGFWRRSVHARGRGFGLRTFWTSTPRARSWSIAGARGEPQRW